MANHGERDIGCPQIKLRDSWSLLAAFALLTVCGSFVHAQEPTYFLTSMTAPWQSAVGTSSAGPVRSVPSWNSHVSAAVRPDRASSRLTDLKSLVSESSVFGPRGNSVFSWQAAPASTPVSRRTAAVFPLPSGGVDWNRTPPSGLPLMLVSETESAEEFPANEGGSCVSGEESKPPLCFWTDVRTSPTWLSQDLAALISIENAIFLSAAGGGAILLRNNVDAQVQQSVAQHGGYWGGTSRWLNRAGESVVHVPLLAGMYWYSLYAQDDDLHELALTLVASYKFTAISTLVLQYATDTRHGHYGGLTMLTDSGFPSMPAATSFALAAVLDEKYGWRAGIPAYVGAGLIGWAGIDQQQHHVSDVVFGAALGFVIGKSIGALHYRPDARFKLVPFVDTPTGSQGLQFVQQF